MYREASIYVELYAKYKVLKFHYFRVYGGVYIDNFIGKMYEFSRPFRELYIEASIMVLV